MKGAHPGGHTALTRETQTPLMQQYREIKQRHQDALLFFRMGDFYEMFYEDAEVASRVLGLTLTARNNGGAADVPLAGVPVKAVNEYLRRLVQRGYRVAICEQMEDPRSAKGIVKREVIETITPGAAFADDLLDGARNNYLCAIKFGAPPAPSDPKGRAASRAAARAAAPVGRVGIAAADISTGELRLILADAADLDGVLARLTPSEVLVAAGSKDGAAVGEWTGRTAAAERLAISSPRDENALITERDPWELDADLGREELTRQFGVLSLDGFGISREDDLAVGAAGALLRYLRELQPGGVPHLARPVIERPGQAMPLDEMTRRNLELTESLRGSGRDGDDTAGTLLAVLDRTVTPMGARLLRQWMLTPLTSREGIEARLDGVEAFARDALARAALRDALDGVRDVQRLASKAAAGRATPRELGALGTSLGRLPRVEEAALRVGTRGVLGELMARWDGCADLGDAIAGSLVERPPAAIGEEPAIRAGVDEELDSLRALRDGGKDGIARIQSEERARTGIPSLKVGYNRVFGYYLEVTNSNQHLVPTHYQRRQTLTGAERYVTPELKEFEERVLTAAERIEARECELFEKLRERIGGEIVRLQCVAGICAQLDVLSALAEVAEREAYTRPELTTDFTLEILEGRHPVVERMMPREKFIPNDITLTEDARIIILTGPNMAGKSTILRQIGLIVLMAQMGSFVPARSARIGIADRLFTRVGASDNLVRGQSTFMVEMSETSAILNTATKRSLVLLDEIGRGTSTYDGVSIAWAVSEHLHNVTGCKTVFATHYHELTQLADELVAVRNYNVAVREVGDQVLFLHRLEPGGADRSYGIEVGRLAGLPKAVLQRAREMLKLLEGGHLMAREREMLATPKTVEQLPLFATLPNPIVERLKTTDIDTMTPLQALELLAELAREAGRESP